ncbi:NAD-dependent epimerase/dehydratase family protein [Actinotalea sp.]|uniref:NAD-dependent epimerase/dehydratase family protein n=1 Tax=Actinotalea sp. TaxID=1872145 RepID=UPI002C7E8239|nr:NAD-dependent epimerase/dehydratase family protein [Actinotalea sp.]HQY32995.1 NAD-dependent epimerase/dehydratase family protein [Actinotalea sp.]HRA51740.1 NAD-dependent epimerase/dehydratase family protein [Actinotalea sp.]
MTPAPAPAHPPATDPVVVVAGGTGLVGSAVVAALRARGTRVVVPTRRNTRHDDAPRSPADDGVRTVQVTSWEDPHELRAVLAEPGWHPGAAVAAIGGWWLGPELVALDPATWRGLVESHLTGHFLVVRALAPLLTGPDPAYVLLNGAAATEPMAGSGPVSVTGAAQRMLLEVLRAETLGARVRFHEVDVTVSVAGDERNLDPAHTVPVEQVAAAVVDVLDRPASPAVVPVAPRADVRATDPARHGRPDVRP